MNKYHFIGIGGIGMSALARILLKRGAEVQGSDPVSNYVTEDLKKAGAKVFSHHSSLHLQSPCTAIYGSAIKPEHPEYQAAVRQKFPLLHRSELLADLMRGYQTLLVTGTHGKTTTSCLLTHVLHVAGLQPTFALGGVALNFYSNGEQGEGNYFVAEADESDGSFLRYPAHGAIITNIEEDHLDHWKTGEALIEGFRQFASKVPSLLWWCADDPTVSSLSLQGHSYGFMKHADLQITHWHQDGFKLIFDLAFQGKIYPKVELSLIGKHNVENAAAVFGLCLELGISETGIREAFKTFKGVKRRLESKGEKRAVSFYDDYAHHPTEIVTTLKGIRKAIGEKRLIVAFQPHRYTRVKDFWNDFITAFEEADVVFMTDIWSAGEKTIEGITIEKLYQEISVNPFPVFYHPRAEFSANIAKYLRPHDVVITLGAGDVTEVCKEILEQEISPYLLAVCQGGKSAEHEVALRSAKVLMSEMNPDYYVLKSFTITKMGEWVVEGQKKSLPDVAKELLSCDLVFPVLHGPFGEDGMLQGFFETLNIPYVGADFRSCALTMDKAWTKHIAARHGVEIARFREFSMYDWEQYPEAVLQQILEEFTFPFYVKAVHLGSTFGVYKVKNEQAVKEAIENIRHLDYRFLVEEEMIGRELEFGFIGNFAAAIADPAEVIRDAEIHTYANKYSTAGKPSIPKAQMPPEVLAKGREIAKTVYHAVGCTGLARIDFFLKDDGTWVLNEVNPMPGCTPTSVYPAIWKAEGVSMRQVVDRVIIAGLHRKRYIDRHLRPPEQTPIIL